MPYSHVPPQPNIDRSAVRSSSHPRLSIISLGKIIVALYVGSSIVGGLQFFVMTWASQHMLRNVRVDLFKHMHRLTLGYYSKHETGNIMSRITNDTDFNSTVVRVK